MKKIYTLIAGIMLTAIVFAQAPEKMSYQAVVRDPSNALVATQAVGMQISILQGGATGTAVYVETQSPTTNANGLVSLEIGSGTVVSGDFTTIDWGADTYFIKTETDPTGGTSYTITGTSQLLSVPYAMYAKTAENVTNDLVDDADADPTNEMNTSVVLNGLDLEVTDGNGTIVTDLSSLQDGVNDADADPTNEIQNISSVLTTGNDASGNSILNTGQIGLGTLTPDASAAIDMNTTTGALLLPRLTTLQRDALTPQEGMMIYNTDELKFQGYSYGSGYGPENIDQQHLIINNGGGENRAQSFTAGISGSLTSVELPLSAMMGAFDVNIAIRDGDGTGGTVLHSQNFTIPNGTSTWYTFPIVGVNVISGNSYTIHVTEVSSCGMPPCYNWGMDTSGDNYSGGLFYYGGTPYSGGIYDCAFKTNVAPTIPSVLEWVDLH